MALFKQVDKRHGCPVDIYVDIEGLLRESAKIISGRVSANILDPVTGVRQAHPAWTSFVA